MATVTGILITTAMLSLSVADKIKRKAEFIMNLKEKIIDMLGGITKEEHLERRKNAYVEGYERAERDVAMDKEHIHEGVYHQGFIEGHSQAQEELEVEIEDIIENTHEEAYIKGLNEGFNMGYDAAFQEEIEDLLCLEEGEFEFDVEKFEDSFDEEDDEVSISLEEKNKLEADKYMEGFNHGYEEGYEDGFEDGYASGHVKGFAMHKNTRVF